jgi:hypothetical protein
MLDKRKKRLGEVIIIAVTVALSILFYNNWFIPKTVVITYTATGEPAANIEVEINCPYSFLAGKYDPLGASLHDVRRGKSYFTDEQGKVVFLAASGPDSCDIYYPASRGDITVKVQGVETQIKLRPEEINSTNMLYRRIIFKDREPRRWYLY